MSAFQVVGVLIILGAGFDAARRLVLPHSRASRRLGLIGDGLLIGVGLGVGTREAVDGTLWGLWLAIALPLLGEIWSPSSAEDRIGSEHANNRGHTTRLRGIASLAFLALPLSLGFLWLFWSRWDTSIRAAVIAFSLLSLAVIIWIGIRLRSLADAEEAEGHRTNS